MKKSIFFAFFVSLIIFSCKNSDKEQDESKIDTTNIADTVIIKLINPEKFGFKATFNVIKIDWGDKNIEISDSKNKKELFHNYQKKEDNKDTIIIKIYAENLEKLNVENNNIVSLNVSKSRDLKTLNCSSNLLKDINITSNRLIDTLKCFNNELTKINLFNNVKLKYLDCSKNKFKKLYLSKNIDLEILNCKESNLNFINLSKNNKLKHIDLSHNKLRSIEFAQNKDLIRVNCENNKISTMILKDNSKLRYLDCSYNKLKESVLNDIFKNLPIVEDKSVIIIMENKGTINCDVSIAGNKAWQVVDKEQNM